MEQTTFSETLQKHKLWSIPPNMRETGCFFFADTFRSFLLRHFGHWNLSAICLTVVLKLAVAVCFSLYFQIFWPKWLNFFWSFQNDFGPWPKKNSVRIWARDCVVTSVCGHRPADLVAPAFWTRLRNLNRGYCWMCGLIRSNAANMNVATSFFSFTSR